MNTTIITKAEVVTGNAEIIMVVVVELAKVVVVVVVFAVVVVVVVVGRQHKTGLK